MGSSTVRIARIFSTLFLAMIVLGLLAPVAGAQTLDCPTCGVEDVVEETVGTVEETVGNTSGGGGGGGGGGGSSDPDPINELDPTDDDFLGEDFLSDDIPDVVSEIVEPEKQKKKKKERAPEETTGGNKVLRPQTGSDVFLPETGKIGVAAAREAEAAQYPAVKLPPTKRQLSSAANASSFSTGPLTLGELAEALVQAGKMLTFPLGLALAVVAYLMVQGRIDAKDPKLILAAVDSEEEYLSFS